MWRVWFRAVMRWMAGSQDHSPKATVYTHIEYGLVAQWLERSAHNGWVVGSIPTESNVLSNGKVRYMS